MDVSPYIEERYTLEEMMILDQDSRIGRDAIAVIETEGQNQMSPDQNQAMTVKPSTAPVYRVPCVWIVVVTKHIRGPLQLSRARQRPCHKQGRFHVVVHRHSFATYGQGTSSDKVVGMALVVVDIELT
ncbi:hypothetical protein N7452_007925 [Penicillium brevicompactum]|uniref:Uncharacterized protein n=1 Tax=Penicillium brevicompactum TaxID=5074 RepID=A0A9W9QHJ9_PENBR|nr:hypothetical protein N7452_007925 [Penicillium brevicompactum]